MPGYVGLYEVSNCGRVRNVRTGAVRKPQPVKRGHLHVDLWRDGVGRSFYVHRLVLQAFVGPCPPGMEALHRNGNPTDNRVENLRWGTRSQNLHDSVRHGTHQQASKTRCLAGHALQPPNLVPSSARKGRRDCLACSRARARVRQHPHLRDDLQAVAGGYYRAIVQAVVHSV